MPARDPAGSGPAPGAGDGLAQLCTFRVGGEDYAIDIMRVREIINPLPVTPVPRAPAFVEGVIRLRGDVIPVIDVRRRLGLPVTPPTRKTKTLIVHVAGRRLGLVVDEVTEVLRIPRPEIRPSPGLVEAGGARFFLGVCGGESAAAGRRGTTRLRLLLNVRALLEPVSPGEVEAARTEAETTRRT